MERRDEIRIGLLFSSTGPYATIARAMLNGARLAIDEVNADPAFPFTLAAADRRPGGPQRRLRRRGPALPRRRSASSTSSAATPPRAARRCCRCFEKHDGLLWYPSHYEGFESSENIVYTGAAPNQHIVPLAEHLLRHHGDAAYCIGSNYIWAWENNKIMREAVLAAGGRSWPSATSRSARPTSPR